MPDQDLAAVRSADALAEELTSELAHQERPEFKAKPVPPETMERLERVADEINLSAFHSPNSRNSQWMRGLIVAARAPEGIPAAVVFSDDVIARLERIAGILERAESDALRSPELQLSRAIEQIVTRAIEFDRASRGEF